MVFRRGSIRGSSAIFEGMICLRGGLSTTLEGRPPNQNIHMPHFAARAARPADLVRPVALDQFVDPVTVETSDRSAVEDLLGLEGPDAGVSLRQGGRRSGRADFCVR